MRQTMLEMGIGILLPVLTLISLIVFIIVLIKQLVTFKSVGMDRFQPEKFGC
jgi:uncharacterized membrane protein